MQQDEDDYMDVEQLVLLQRISCSFSSHQGETPQNTPQHGREIRVHQHQGELRTSVHQHQGELRLVLLLSPADCTQPPEMDL
ncbi:unnamed protein product [Arctogadus glacialis]